MKLQAVGFMRKRSGNIEYGFAKLNNDFDCHDVEWIIDSDGDKVIDPWNYRLLNGRPGYLAVV